MKMKKLKRMLLFIMLVMTGVSLKAEIITYPVPQGI